MTARRTLPAVAVVALIAASPAHAQDPAPAPEAQAVPRTAVPRENVRSAPATHATREAPPASEARPRMRAPGPMAETAAAPMASAEEQRGGRRNPGAAGGGGRSGGGADSGGARPRSGEARRPDNDNGVDRGTPRPGAQAIPRSQAPRPPRTVYVPVPRRYYGGPVGFGYYAYDPWSWYAGYGWAGYGWNSWGWGGPGWGGPGWGGPGWGGAGYYAGPYGWSIGGVRLKVQPKDAEVYVDGYYAGIVDDFDGVWQQLRLDDGGHRIEVRKAGFTTLTFEVMIQPGRTITYRGEMTTEP